MPARLIPNVSNPYCSTRIIGSPELATVIRPLRDYITPT
jgi:hypothetical protein